MQKKAKSLGLKILRPVLSGCVTGASEVMVGIFRTPAEFVEVAKLAEHQQTFRERYLTFLPETL